MDPLPHEFLTLSLCSLSCCVHSHPQIHPPFCCDKKMEREEQNMHIKSNQKTLSARLFCTHFFTHFSLLSPPSLPCFICHNHKSGKYEMFLFYILTYGVFVVHRNLDQIIVWFFTLPTLTSTTCHLNAWKCFIESVNSADFLAWSQWHAFLGNI